MNLEELILEYINTGYDYTDACSKICQDIILFKISNSSFQNHITIKDGVVMHLYISNYLEHISPMNQCKKMFLL